MTDDVFKYNSSDVLVQSVLEVPIIIQWPESIVRYEFTSPVGDITFSIIFVAAPEEDRVVDDEDIETIEESERCSTEEEPITGSFMPPCEGILFFIWDNSHDWLSNKKISYSIIVEQVRISQYLPLFFRD